MRKGQPITIAEGDYAGQKGIITFVKHNSCIVAIGPSNFEIPIEYISTGDEIQKVWMIYGEDNSNPNPLARPVDVLPRVKYNHKDEANDEMDRLGRKHPGKTFYLLESVAELTYEMALTKKERAYDE